MQKDEYEAEIGYWQEQLEYHLGNHHRAKEVGSPNSAADNQARAAECASILLALRALAGGE